MGHSPKPDCKTRGSPAPVERRGKKSSSSPLTAAAVSNRRRVFSAQGAWQTPATPRKRTRLPPRGRLSTSRTVPPAVRHPFAEHQRQLARQNHEKEEPCAQCVHL